MSTKDNDSKFVTNSQPSGRFIDGRFDCLAANVYDALKGHRSTKKRTHMLQVETDFGPLYFPMEKLRELTAVLRPARRTDDNPIFSFSLRMDIARMEKHEKLASYPYGRTTIVNELLPILTIKTDGRIKTTTNLYGQTVDPAPFNADNKNIVWNFPAVSITPTERLTAVLDFISYCPPMMETETAVSPIAETTIPQTIAQPAAIAPETAVSAQPAAMVTQPAQPVKIAQPEVTETAVSVPTVTRKKTRTAARRRPDLTKLNVWDRLAHIMADDNLPADYLETLKSRKYQPAWAS